MDEDKKEYLTKIWSGLCNYFGDCNKCPLREDEALCYDDQFCDYDKFEKILNERLCNYAPTERFRKGNERTKRYIEELRNDNDIKQKFLEAASTALTDNPKYIGDLRDFLHSIPVTMHYDKQDTAAFSIAPTAGIIGAAALALERKPIENVRIETPHNEDVFRPTKSMLDILSERIDSDLNKRLTEFGENNGFPVVFVFYQTLKNENGVSMATCDIKMFKFDEKQDARLFAIKHAGEFGFFDPRSKDEQIKDLEKKVKRLEEDRDYWKRKAEGDDDDTLGIFKHWDD